MMVAGRLHVFLPDIRPFAGDEPVKSAVLTSKYRGPKRAVTEMGCFVSQKSHIRQPVRLWWGAVNKGAQVCMECIKINVSWRCDQAWLLVCALEPSLDGGELRTADLQILDRPLAEDRN